jgi:hypothetical protein
MVMFLLYHLESSAFALLRDGRQLTPAHRAVEHFPSVSLILRVSLFLLRKSNRSLTLVLMVVLK